MIIWHLVSNRWNSAITEYALSAARALETAGHASVVSPLAGSPGHARASEAGLATRPLPSFGLSQLGTALSLAREIKPDAIMTYGGPETVLSLFLKTATKARVVRFRGHEIQSVDLLARLRQRLSHAHVDILLTPSRGLAEALSRLDSKRTIRSVVLGCDEARFRRIQPPDGGRPELLVLGRLDPVKGHGALFGIFAAMKPLWTRTEMPPRLHVVGQPANLSVEDLKGLAVAAGLSLGSDVLFTSTRVESIAQLLSSATVGVVPSVGSEVIARVAEEFLLCGTPIAVSGVGSLDEALCFEGAGMSYRGMSMGDAARALTSLVERAWDEGEAVKVRRAERAKQVFSLRAMGQSLSSLIQEG